MIELPDPTSVRRVADWVELNVSVSRERISKALVSSTIESLTGTEPAETFTSDVWRELEYRHQLYREPPFDISEDTIEARSDVDASNEYLACLLLSLFGVRGVTRNPAKLFERITSKAVEMYLSGRAVVFGWPSPPESDSADEESQIARKIKKVAEDLGERFAESPPARFNDRGVDVIGWIPFLDRRSSQLVLLVQCYAGQDVTGKVSVPLASWYQYIHWACNPIRGFAVPRVMRPIDWHEASTDQGLLFDRPRIMSLIPRDTYDPELAEELTVWVKEQLTELEA